MSALFRAVAHRPVRRLTPPGDSSLSRRSLWFDLPIQANNDSTIAKGA